MTVPGEEPARAIGFSLQYQITDKFQIVVQTHVDQEWDQSVIDGALDKAAAAVNRQRKVERLRMLQEWAPLKAQRLADMTKDLDDIDAGHRKAWEDGPKRGPFKLDVKEASQRDAALKEQSRYKREIELDNIEIAALTKELKGDGA